MHVCARPLLHIVDQHVEEAGHLSHVRQFLLVASQPRLQALHRHDQRLAAHVDGISVAGDAGWQACEQAVAAGTPGAVFTAAVCAIESTDAARVQRIVSLAQALPAAYRALADAFNWVSAQWLKGLIRDLLEGASPTQRSLALLACAAHRVDPGPALARALEDADQGLCCTALRCIGDAGRADLRDACLAQVRDRGADACRRFWAARAGLLLGERHLCPALLQDLAGSPGPWRRPAFELLAKVMDASQAAEFLQPLGREPGGERGLIRGIGLLGDPAFVPWLIERMADPGLARLCGESFTLITGCELDHPDLLLRTPDGELAVPVPDADAGEGDLVPLDEDEGLPLADPQQVGAWWACERGRFVPGRRVLMGQAPYAASCHALLRGARQRQRVVAAEHLALQEPEQPLFNTAAPAWRQMRWLGEPGHAGGAAQGPS